MMVDLNRLREAIGREADEGPMASLWAFAEAGRAVLDAPSVRWCVVHKCTLSDPIDGDPWTCTRAEWEPYSVLGTDEPCEVVDAVVVPVSGGEG